MRPYYQEKGITIYNGDCREVLPSLTADAIVTDPPYGMNKASWDCFIPPELWLPLVRSIGPTYVFCGVKALFDYPRPDWTLAWVRVASAQRNGKYKGFNNWEPILAYGLSALSNDVICVPNYGESDGHPTTKPLALLKHLIARVAGDTVLDPFMGSGTTLVAAKDHGRKAIGIEIEERYCEIAAKRLSQGVFNFKGGLDTGNGGTDMAIGGNVLGGKD